MKKHIKLIAYSGIALVLAFQFLYVQLAQAGIYNSNTDVTYKEYWVPHSEFTAGCGDAEDPDGNAWYFEPGPCSKTLELNIPDNFSQALKAEIYLDLWRNYDLLSARFTINGGPTHIPDVGYDWSRTPWVSEIPLSELVQGVNTFVFTVTGGRRYHVHDIAIRLYYDAANPLIAGPGSDVTPPSGQLTSIVASNGTFSPATGGTLDVDSDQITLNATASGAKYVEFHASYYGYDEDNDGDYTDWHNRNRNNWNPGGVGSEPESGGTIDHIGTDLTAPYSATWLLPHIRNQTGVRFKIRIVDAAGNVRETAGGQSASFELARSFAVDTFMIPNFDDAILWANGTEDSIVTYTINLPADMTGYIEAYMVGAYWQNPRISINDNSLFNAFASGEDVWKLSVRKLNMAHLRPGANQIEYSHRSGWGEFIERPGPMFVLRRGTSPITPTPTATATATPTPTATQPGATPTATGTATATATVQIPVTGPQIFLPLVVRSGD